MSVRVMASVWKDSVHKGSTLLLLLAIADFADDDGVAYPSIDTLANKTRLSRRNVQLLCKHAELSGELKIDKNAGPYACNVYRLQHKVRAKIAPVQTSDTELHEGGANQCHQISPKPSGTINNHQEQEVERFLSAWKESGLPPFINLTRPRRDKIRTRLNDPFFRDNYPKALDLAKRSPFLMGQNDRGWKAELDWFLKSDSVVKIVEGKYNNKKNRSVL